MAKNNDKEKSLEQWLWDAACAIRGAQDAPKFKDYILPLVFTKRLCDVFDDEVNRVAHEVKSRTRALQLIEKDHKLVRFYLPLRAKDLEKDRTWEVVRLLVVKENESVGQQLTDIMRSIARENKPLDGIINRIDFNATTHGQRDIDDDSLNRLITKISEKGLGLHDVEPDIIGRSYEYLIRKFAEGGGQSAGEFYTPKEVGMIMARILNPEPGMEAYDPNTGSAGLLIKMQLVLQEKMQAVANGKFAPLKLFGQEFNPATWAMANMNMVIHDIAGQISIGNTMTNPSRFDAPGNALKKFDLVTANPMWNQDSFSKSTYDNDELNRFGHTHPDGTVVDFPPSGTADWAWAQHILASMKDNGRAAIILDTGAVSRGSGSTSKSSEKDIRKWFVENDLIEGVIYLPDNLFYNTSAPGIILFLNKAKSGTDKAGKIFLVNATRHFIKGNPKNYMDDVSADLIADTFINWREVEKLSRIVNRAEIEKHDFNLSPNKYIHTADDINHRDISELVAELHDLEEEAQLIDSELNYALTKILTDGTQSESTQQTDIGEIPTDWEPVTIGSEFDIQQGKQVSAKTKEGDNQKPFLRTSNVFWNNIDLTVLDKMNFTAAEELRMKLQVNDVLVCEGGDVGRTALVTTEMDGIYYQNHLHRLRAKNDTTNPLYFVYWMMYCLKLTEYYNGAGNKTTIPNLSQARVKALLFPKPERTEQDSIAKILSLIQSAIEIREQINKVLSSLFQSMQFNLLTGNIRLPNAEQKTVLEIEPKTEKV